MVLRAAALLANRAGERATAVEIERIAVDVAAAADHIAVDDRTRFQHERVAAAAQVDRVGLRTVAVEAAGNGAAVGNGRAAGRDNAGTACRDTSQAGVAAGDTARVDDHGRTRRKNARTAIAASAAVTTVATGDRAGVRHCEVDASHAHATATAARHPCH